MLLRSGGTSHLEGHGFEEETGFTTGNKSYCSWEQFKDLITQLNVASDLNLIVVLATCFGGSFVRAMNTIDRAPVLGLIGPTREIYTRDVEVDFPAFYKTFFHTASMAEAIAALNSRGLSGLYYGITAQEFFYTVWAEYKKRECTEGQIDIRARRMYRKVKGQSSVRTPSIGQLKRMLRSKEQEERLFEKYRNNYFMYDLDPDNRSRFPVTYKDAEVYASS